MKILGVGAFLFMLISHDVSAQSQDSVASKPNKLIDTIAPEFKVIDVAGNTWALKQLSGKTVVINFWAIGCKGCVVELPELNKVADSLSSDTSIVFLSFLLDGGPQAEEFLKKHPIAYHVVINSYPLMLTYRVNCFPTHMIIDRYGVIRYNECEMVAWPAFVSIIRKYHLK